MTDGPPTCPDMYLVLTIQMQTLHQERDCFAFRHFHCVATPTTRNHNRLGAPISAVQSVAHEIGILVV